MSALLFIYSASGVAIGTDTLVSDGITMSPLFYTSKAFPVRHLKSLICGTGYLNLISEWYSYAMRNIIGFDITALNSNAPETLNQIYERDDLAKKTSTSIYQFGFSQSANRLMGSVFRSENNFQLEELEEGFGLKPDHPEIREKASTLLVSCVNAKELFIEVIKVMRSVDNALPLEKKVGIGGEIQFLSILNDGDITIETIFQFSDFFEIYDKMLSRNK